MNRTILTVLALALPFTLVAREYTFNNKTNHQVTLKFGYSSLVINPVIEAQISPGKSFIFLMQDNWPHVSVSLYGGSWRESKGTLIFIGSGGFDAPPGNYIIEDTLMPSTPVPPLKEIVYGAIAFLPTQAHVVEVPDEELEGPRRTNDELFRAMHRWANKKGYSSAYPNFEIRGKVRGAVAFDKGSAVIKDIPASELPNSDTTEGRFRAIHQWANRNGFVAGYPNFEQANYGGGVVFQAVLFPKNSASVVEVPAPQLSNFSSFEQRMRAFHRWAGRSHADPVVSTIPNFEQRNK